MTSTDNRACAELTVILCTCNRAQSLTETLESLTSSRLPRSVVWEVLVVDNNSTDQTRGLVEEFCRRYPGRFRYLLESKPGKSHALNAGIASARGEVLVFVDDDVTVGPDWLQNLTAELLRNGEWAGVAGRILPAHAFKLPPWLVWKYDDGAFRPDPLGILCAHFDLGDEPKELNLDEAPYGANMAFKRSAFSKYGGFRIDLGPRPTSQIRGEDVEFGRRLMRAGERLRYEPSAVVYHPVPQGRITKEFFLSWWFDFGRASIIERPDRPDIYGIPRDRLSLLRRLVDIFILSLRGIFAVGADKRFFCKCMVWRHAGMVAELYRRSVRRNGRSRRQQENDTDKHKLTHGPTPSSSPDREAETARRR